MSHVPMFPLFHHSGASQELEQRLALVGPKDTSRGFLFGTALEVVRSEGTAAALKRCALAAGGEHFTAFFSYPITTLLKLTYAAARELRVLHGSFNGAMEHLGLRAAPRFLDSASGKMLLSLVGKEPRRLLESMPTAYKTAWDHGQCRLTWRGPQRGQLHYTSVIPVSYFVGSVRQVLSAARLEGRVVGQQESLTESTVDFSWA